MKQRLRLASAIVHDPQLLILDEPTNGTDHKGREEILQFDYDLAYNKDMSVLFSSHLLTDVEAVCDYVVVLGAGRILAQGKIKELKEIHRQSFEVRLKESPEAFIEHLKKFDCLTEYHDDLVRVQMPKDRDEKLLWETAASLWQQIS